MKQKDKLNLPTQVPLISFFPGGHRHIGPSGLGTQSYAHIVVEHRSFACSKKHNIKKN